jgi:hypothetical protein
MDSNSFFKHPESLDAHDGKNQVDSSSSKIKWEMLVCAGSHKMCAGHNFGNPEGVSDSGVFQYN